MPNVSFGGLASGLDTGAIIQQLLALEARPLRRLESQRSNIIAKQGQFDTFKSKLQTLSDALTTLKDTKELSLFTTSSSDESIVEVSADGAAIPGNFTIGVTQLAAARSESFQSPFADKDTSTFGAGQIDITSGVSNPTVTSVSIAATDTLQDIRDKINDADAGVRASIINDGTNFQLVLTSSETGADNAFTATSSGFATDPLGTPQLLQAAQDANLTIDGLAVTSASNSVTEAVEGVTFKLKSTGSNVDVAIDRDLAAIGDRLQEVIDAYNGVLDYIDSNNADREVALTGIESQLRSAFQTVLDSTSFTFFGLSQVGITTNSAGRAQLDRSDLEDAIEQDFDAVVELFAGDGTDDGFAQIFDLVLNGDDVNAGILSPGNGALQLRQDALGDRIRALDAQIAIAERRLDRTEQALTRRFAAFESLTSQFQAQGAFISQALAGL